MRALHRRAVVGETLRHALHTLAVVAPEWVRAVSPPAWRDRYTRRAEDDRLPTTQTARAALTRIIGHDGRQFLAAVAPPDAPPWRREVPAVALLRRGWIPNDRGDGPRLQWREADNIPPAARFLSSPYDPDAHDARQHSTPWGGDKGPMTEPCEDDGPHRIPHVETTPGPAADGEPTPPIHAALPQRGFRPGPHIVDTGCLDAALLIESQDDHGVDLLGPTRLDDHWQARAGAGFDAQHFPRDGDQQHASCPAGTMRISWTPALDHRGNPVIKGKCSANEGRRCDHVAQGVRAKQRAPRRTLTIRPQPPYQALQAARQRETTEALQAAYARRAGSEGPISRGTRSTRLRRTRYLGLARGRWGHLLTAAGLNVRRLGEWFLETARAKPRITPFARLMAAGVAA